MIFIGAVLNVVKNVTCTLWSRHLEPKKRQGYEQPDLSNSAAMRAL